MACPSWHAAPERRCNRLVVTQGYCHAGFRPATGGSGKETRGGNVAETYNGYCVKCKEKRDFEGEVVVSDSGRRMAKGQCPVCGTKMNRILGKA
jgi:hypothetical protein